MFLKSVQLHVPAYDEWRRFRNPKHSSPALTVRSFAALA
jgi:hypothetical protein